MITEEAKKAAANKAPEQVYDWEEHNFMCNNEICPRCAVPVKRKWCGFLWHCLSLTCGQCGKVIYTYPFDSFT